MSPCIKVTGGIVYALGGMRGNIMGTDLFFFITFSKLNFVKEILEC